MTFSAKRPAELLAAASGLVFASSTPPIDFQPGILLGLVGFALALAPDDGRGARTGFWFGLSANLLALRFVPEVIARFTPLPLAAGWLALVLLSAAQALAWVVAGALMAWLARPRERSRRPPVPRFLAVAVGVYAATFVPVVFPWTPAGGLTRWPAMLQSAELVGERGATFLVTAACALVADAILVPRADRRRAVRTLAIASAILAALLVHGALRMRAIEAARVAAPRAKVAVLSPDFDAMFRWQPQQAARMLDRLTALTRRAEEAGAVLTIWPESAYPYTLAHGIKTSPTGARAILQPGVRGPVLTGAYLSKGGGLGTNSAILVEPNGDIGPSYDKRHLLWFGETVPLADAFPILRHVFARGTGIAPGTDTVPFRAGPVVATVLNCYEDTLPQAGREAMAPRPNLLVNITNDAWFAGSAEPELHLRLSVLRSIEARRDLLRSVNRGPASWVSATGSILARRDAAPGLGPAPPLVADVALLDAPVTLFTVAGDTPLVALVALALVFHWVRGRRVTS